MRKNIQATPVYLKRLNKKLTLAMKGHKLLKEKLDSLISVFIQSIHQTQKTRKQMNLMLSRYTQSYYQASLWYGEDELAHIITQTHLAKIQREAKYVYGMAVPSYTLEDIKDTLKTSEELLYDVVYNNQGLLEIMVQLSNDEKKTLILGEEIKSIKRRVNALEYKTIPQLQKDIHTIKLKLEDQQRNEQARILKQIKS